MLNLYVFNYNLNLLALFICFIWLVLYYIIITFFKNSKIKLLLNNSAIKNNFILKFHKINLNLPKYLSNVNNFKKKLININVDFLTSIRTRFKISFSASNIVKYLSELSINKSTILFLRKNKVFNKSRYSRNRQTYRTGAYWCLYVNIIAVIAFYFWFYNFTMNFGYVWWLLYTFILSFFIFKAIKFNFYNIKTLINEYLLSVKWVYTIITSLTKYLSVNFNNLFLLYKTRVVIKCYFSIKTNLKTTKSILISLNKINDYLYDKLVK